MESADAAMDRYASGDDGAFAEVYDAIAPRIYRHILRITRDASVAEDVVQQTMLQIHRSRGTFVRGAAVLPWAMAIARRLAVDAHRRGRKEALASMADPAEPLSPDPDAEAHAVAAETARRIREQLAKLPQTQRTAFELIKQDGLSVEQAAAVLGVSVSAVKLRAHRAYEALRAVLAEAAEEGRS
jgi:RNA polymerase sigma-70 factor (ECF subfamily)